MAEQKGISRKITLPDLPDIADDEPATLSVQKIRAYLVDQQQAIDRLYGLISQRMNDMLMSGSSAERPDAEFTDRLFQDTTSNVLYFDNGSSWTTT